MNKAAIFSVLCSLLMAASCSTSNTVLTVEGGRVQGVEGNTPGVLVFRGIPFAAPTSGENRWREPQSVIPWEGVKIADKWAPAAPQVPDIPGSFYQKEFRWDSGPE
jgi:para-nitrobenzyl esterase